MPYTDDEILHLLKEQGGKGDWHLENNIFTIKNLSWDEFDQVLGEMNEAYHAHEMINENAYIVAIDADVIRQFLNPPAPVIHGQVQPHQPQPQPQPQPEVLDPDMINNAINNMYRETEIRWHNVAPRAEVAAEGLPAILVSEMMSRDEANELAYRMNERLYPHIDFIEEQEEGMFRMAIPTAIVISVLQEHEERIIVRNAPRVEPPRG